MNSGSGMLDGCRPKKASKRKSGTSTNVPARYMFPSADQASDCNTHILRRCQSGLMSHATFIKLFLTACLVMLKPLSHGQICNTVKLVSKLLSRYTRLKLTCLHWTSLPKLPLSLSGRHCCGKFKVLSTKHVKYSRRTRNGTSKV